MLRPDAQTAVPAHPPPARSSARFHVTELRAPVRVREVTRPMAHIHTATSVRLTSPFSPISPVLPVLAGTSIVPELSAAMWPGRQLPAKAAVRAAARAAYTAHAASRLACRPWPRPCRRNSGRPSQLLLLLVPRRRSFPLPMRPLPERLRPAEDARQHSLAPHAPPPSE